MLKISGKTHTKLASKVAPRQDETQAVSIHLESRRNKEKKELIANKYRTQLNTGICWDQELKYPNSKTMFVVGCLVLFFFTSGHVQQL